MIGYQYFTARCTAAYIDNRIAASRISPPIHSAMLRKFTPVSYPIVSTSIAFPSMSNSSIIFV
jgi:hypothetical protein